MKVVQWWPAIFAPMVPVALPNYWDSGIVYQTLGGLLWQSIGAMGTDFKVGVTLLFLTLVLLAITGWLLVRSLKAFEKGKEIRGLLILLAVIFTPTIILLILTLDVDIVTSGVWEVTK